MPNLNLKDLKTEKVIIFIVNACIEEYYLPSNYVRYLQNSTWFWNLDILLTFQLFI